MTPDTEAAHVAPLHDTMDTDSPHESDLRLSWAQETGAGAAANITMTRQAAPSCPHVSVDSD